MILMRKKMRFEWWIPDGNWLIYLTSSTSPQDHHDSDHGITVDIYLSYGPPTEIHDRPLALLAGLCPTVFQREAFKHVYRVLRYPQVPWIFFADLTARQ